MDSWSSAPALALLVSLCGYCGLCLCCGVFRSTDWMNYEAAAIQLYQYWARNPDKADLPTQLQGVFWMSGNPGNEITLTLWDCRHDKQRRTLSFYPGGGCCGAGCSSKQSWTYGEGFKGIVLYLINRGLFIWFVFYFNEDYSFAEIKLYLFSFIPIPSCLMYFEMVQGDRIGDLWHRRSTICGCPLKPGTYSLRRVITADGQRLPAFAEMVESVESGELKKSKVQGIPLPLLAQSDARAGLHREFEAEHAETQRLLADGSRQPSAAMCACAK